jgi:hypothetical protein
MHVATHLKRFCEGGGLQFHRVETGIFFGGFVRADEDEGLEERGEARKEVQQAAARLLRAVVRWGER